MTDVQELQSQLRPLQQFIPKADIEIEKKTLANGASARVVNGRLFLSSPIPLPPAVPVHDQGQGVDGKRGRREQADEDKGLDAPERTSGQQKDGKKGDHRQGPTEPTEVAVASEKNKQQQSVPVVVKIIDIDERSEELRAEVVAYSRIGWLSLSVDPLSSIPCLSRMSRVRGAYGMVVDSHRCNKMVLERMDTSLYCVLNDGDRGLNHWMPSASRTLEAIMDIAEGLEQLHRSGVVHCDLRPSNVLLSYYQRASLTEDTPVVIAKIADLGTSDPIGAEFDTEYVKRRQPLVHLTSDRIASPAIDINGVGVMIVELLSARPINGNRELTVARKGLAADLEHYLALHQKANASNDEQEQSDRERGGTWRSSSGNNDDNDDSKKKKRRGHAVYSTSCNDVLSAMRSFKKRPRANPYLRKAFANDILVAKELFGLAEECIRANPSERPSLPALQDRLQFAAALAWY